MDSLWVEMNQLSQDLRFIARDLPMVIHLVAQSLDLIDHRVDLSIKHDPKHIRSFELNI